MDYPLGIKKGQASVELVLTFAVLVLFLVGAVKMMLWFGNNLGHRARAYSITRRQAITSPPGAADAGYEQSELSIFRD